ncbi:MAG: hypothetical protein ACUVRQ_00275 [Thermoanaerobaculaceae bacterium]
MTFGLRYEPNDLWSLGTEASYTRAAESMDRITFNVPEEILSRLIDSNYDLTQVHTYSDLSSSQWDVNLWLSARLSSRSQGVFSYRFTEFSDRKPYIQDLTGRLAILSAGLRWTF